MFSKVPRRTLFDTVESYTTGPASYQIRDSANKTTCDDISIRSESKQIVNQRIQTLQNQLKEFGLHVKERDSMIERITMEKRAVMKRYEMLLESYKKLRKVSLKLVPQEKLPLDQTRKATDFVADMSASIDSPLPSTSQEICEQLLGSSEGKTAGAAQEKLEETLSNLRCVQEESRLREKEILLAEKNQILKQIEDITKKRFGQLETLREKLGGIGGLHKNSKESQVSEVPLGTNIQLQTEISESRKDQSLQPHSAVDKCFLDKEKSENSLRREYEVMKLLADQMDLLIRDLEKRLEDTKANHAQRLQELERQYDDVRTENKSCKKESEEMRKRIEELKKEEERQVNTVNQLFADNELLLSERAHLHEQLSSLNHHYSQLSLQRNSSLEKCAHVTSTIDKLKARNEKLQQCVQKSRADNQKLKMKNENLERILSERSKKSDKHKSLIVEHNLRLQISELQGSKSALKKSLNDLEQQFIEQKEANTQIREQHELQITAHVAERKQLQSDLKTLSEKHEQQKSSLKDKHESFISKLHAEFEERQKTTKLEAKELLRAKQTEIDDLKSQIALLENEVNTMKPKVVEYHILKQHNDELMKAATESKRAETTAKETLEEARNEVAELKSKVEAKKTENKTMAALIEMFVNNDEKVKQLEEENICLRQRLNSVTDLLDTLESGIVSTEAKNNAVLRSYAQMEDQIQRLVGHNNSKQRIHYVGKLQTENRMLKEEQVKLREQIYLASKKDPKIGKENAPKECARV